MASLKQLEANRRNALKSTGPRTAAGKAVSRLNALKTGIEARLHVLPGESAEAFHTLASEYYGRYRPTAPEQRALVDTLITTEWFLRRFRRVEHEIWEAEMALIARRDHTDKEHPFAETASRRPETFHRLQRRIDSTWRQFHQALRALDRLQSRDHALEDLAVKEAGSAQAPLELVTPQIGFVPPPVGPTPPLPVESRLGCLDRRRARPFFNPPAPEMPGTRD